MEANATNREGEPAYLVYEFERRAYPLSDGGFTIGRDAASNIVVREPSVSRSHAEVRAEGGEFVLHTSGATGTRNYDWGDQPTAGGYGSMQLHNDGASQPVFAFNRWGTAQTDIDIGIGTNPTTTNGIDWTFQRNGNNYTTKYIQVLVHPTATPIAHKLEIMPVGDSITDGSGAAGGYRSELQT